MQLHRIAQQSRIPGSGFVSNLPDPLAAQHAIAIFVLRDLQGEIEHDQQIDRGDVLSMIERKLAILGHHGEEAGSASPGAG